MCSFRPPTSLPGAGRSWRNAPSSRSPNDGARGSRSMLERLTDTHRPARKHRLAMNCLAQMNADQAETAQILQLHLHLQLCSLVSWRDSPSRHAKRNNKVLAVSVSFPLNLRSSALSCSS